MYYANILRIKSLPVMLFDFHSPIELPELRPVDRGGLSACVLAPGNVPRKFPLSDLDALTLSRCLLMLRGNMDNLFCSWLFPFFC